MFPAASVLSRSTPFALAPIPPPGLTCSSTSLPAFAAVTWYEAPGCHHRISANASQTEPAVSTSNVTSAPITAGFGAMPVIAMPVALKDDESR